MKTHVFRGYIIVFIISIVLAVIMGVFYINKCQNFRETGQAEEWVVACEEKDGNYNIKFTLPNGDVAGKSVAFQSAHFEVEVTIDGQLVYSLRAGNPQFSKSTGYQYNFIKLTEDDAGKEMSITMIPVYKGLIQKEQVYYGDETEIYKTICKASALRFILAVIIFIIGIVLLGYACFVVKVKRTYETLIHFSFFSILLAVWSITESSISDLFNQWPVATMVFDHYALMMMPSAFLMFVKYTFSKKNHPVWSIYLYMNAVIIAVRSLMQFLALYDLKQTLWMTQLSIALFVVICVIMVIREIIYSKMTRQLKINLFCIFCILVATILELVLFKIYQRSSNFGMLGFVFYVVVMSFEMVRESYKMIERAQEAELYRKLAFTDELTGAFNRTAFQHDLDDQMSINEKTGKVSVKPTTIFMFDLNDLKKCNDTYGHNEGDRYIKIVSEVIISVIGISGKCYRIGGDEFCVILPTANQNEIEHKIELMKEEMQEADRKGFVVPISVAIGYAVFDPEYDKTLKDTIKRADVLLYQNKQMIKEQQKNNN